MPKTRKVTASDILANFRKTPQSDLVIKRLEKVEKRKREEEDANSSMLQSFAGVLHKGAFAERKYKIAKEHGDFKGTFWDFLGNPEFAQASYEVGLEKVQDDPSLLPLEGGWVKKLGQGLINLLNPSSVTEPTVPELPGIDLLNPKISPVEKEVL